MFEKTQPSAWTEAKFLAEAPKLRIKVERADTGETVYEGEASGRTFSTGSFGYYATGKSKAMPSGDALQITANLTVVGSKLHKAGG